MNGPLLSAVTRVIPLEVVFHFSPWSACLYRSARRVVCEKILTSSIYTQILRYVLNTLLKFLLVNPGQISFHGNFSKVLHLLTKRIKFASKKKFSINDILIDYHFFFAFIFFTSAYLWYFSKALRFGGERFLNVLRLWSKYSFKCPPSLKG